MKEIGPHKPRWEPTATRGAMSLFLKCLSLSFSIYEREIVPCTLVMHRFTHQLLTESHCMLEAEDANCTDSSEGPGQAVG